MSSSRALQGLWNKAFETPPGEAAQASSPGWLEGLHPRLKKVLKGMGLHEATPAQAALKAPLLAGHHCLLIAPTGVGKTEAAVVPLFHRLLTGGGADAIKGAKAGNGSASSYKPITALYITPLRALNRDMLRRLSELGDQLGVKVAVRHGDTSQAERTRQSKDPPTLLITTPETLQIMLSGRRLRNQLAKVRYVVVDETHELADSQRGAQLAVGLERLVLLAGEFQRIGLSATVGTPEVVAAFLGGVGRSVDILAPALRRETDLRVVAPRPEVEDQQLALELFWEPERIACLRYCAAQVAAAGPTLLFVNTRDTAEALGVRWKLWKPETKGTSPLTDQQASPSRDQQEVDPTPQTFAAADQVAVHHGSLAKQVRVETERAYKNGELQGIICTSSLELGIDVGNTQLVLQYNSPRNPSRLIQRLGRAGHRMGLVARGRLVAAEADQLLEGAVVARRTLAGELEPSRVRSNPLAVIANQLLSWVVCDGEIDAELAYRIFRRAYPFRDLPRERFQAVIDQLASQWQLNWNEEQGILQRKKRSRTYFYDNISMIPDEVSYKVLDTATRNTIGRLDERFVLGLAPGEKIVFRGAAWEVIELTEQEVTVAPVKDMGALPRWVGEDIPVPWSVAQEVGRLRASGNLVDYPFEPSAASTVTEYLEEETTAGRMPTDTLLTVERHDTVLVLNCCGGTRVNATLGLLLSSLLAQRLGGAVGFQSDAYRVVLEVGRRLRPAQLVEHIQDLLPEAIEPLVKLALRSSLALRLNLLTIARKFGAVEKSADMARWGLKRLVDSYEGTLLWEEARAVVLHKTLDLERTARLVADINAGRCQIVPSRPTPMGTAGLRPYKDALKPPRPDKAILAAVRRRLLHRPMLLCCLNCGNQRRRRAQDMMKQKGKEPQSIACPRCQGTMVAALPPTGQPSGPLRDMAEKLGQGKALAESPQKRKLVARLDKNASLVREFKGVAMMTLAARGVGEDTAARLLAHQHESEEGLLRDIIDAEINYARTRQWWD